MANRIHTVIDEQTVYLPGELSRKILLMLDGDSLHRARQVCQGWNEAVLNLIWGEDRAAVETKLKNNWRFAAPARIETTLKLEGFVANKLLSFNGNRAVLMMFKFDPEEEDDPVKIVEFNTKDGKIVNASDVGDRVLDPDCPLPGDCPIPGYFAYEAGNTVVIVWRQYVTYVSFIRRVFAYNLQTHQISFDKVYDGEGSILGDCIANVNEADKEIFIGRTKLKINVVEEMFVGNCNYLPDTIALQSNLCITSTYTDGTKLWRHNGDFYEEISVLHPSSIPHLFSFEINLETSRIISVHRDTNLTFSLSLWDSDTGILIQEETLPSFVSADADAESTFLDQFKIEGNHLVLLVRESREYDENLYHHYRIVIYELDKVLAGEESEPRELSIGSDTFSKLLVDKTSITVASESGTVVKLDFWGCE